jgi:probable rRNA maturation factor
MPLKRSTSVQVYNTTRSKFLPLEKIKKKTKDILSLLKLEGSRLDLHLVTDSKIRGINKKHLGHDYATDVIAFGQQEGEGLSPQIEGRPFLGDVVVSITTARRVAKELKHSFEYELFFYIVHGLLHLQGFDDHTAKERQSMHDEQSRILSLVKISK